jgi:3-mercaptopyruvate sulfurtransferase SseA
MRRVKFLLAISFLLLSTLSCNALLPLNDSNEQPSSIAELPATEAEVPRVTVGDAKAAFDSGEAIIVDVRSRAAYEAAHAVGALSIPLNEFESNIGSIDLPKDQWIITYCT